MIETSKKSGSVWLMGMGVTLVLAGSLFTWVLWSAYVRADATRSWLALPCTVLSSQIKPEKATVTSPTKFLVQVRYQYTHDGQRYVGDRIKRLPSIHTTMEKAESTRQNYVPGQMITCWVNPHSPTEAVLKHDTRAALYSIWFPLLFVFGGLRMAWSAWKKVS
ncbi:MAG: DUF3592 domain-containing protein [Verrucomicrobiaceae bacterium]|nr:DUF3592 domain-containing protein [Verrucomicrobiaceae bacterium]